MNERRPEHFVPGCSLLVTVGVGLRIDWAVGGGSQRGSWRTDVTAVVSTPLARVNLREADACHDDSCKMDRLGCER
jgi:hypothetical protein